MDKPELDTDPTVLSIVALTVAQAARAVQVNPSLLREEIRAGRLKAHRAGAVLLRILKEDLLAWLRSRPAQEPVAFRDPRRRRGRPPKTTRAARSR